MTLRLVLRTLVARPARSAVLAGGFGFGISVMAMLLGVGQVVLEQARSPALQGGGDAVIGGATGRVGSARFLLQGVLGASPLREQVVAVSPSRRERLFLIADDGPVPVRARGGIPSRERAMGDPEILQVDGWVDTAADRTWTEPAPGAILRAMDRFHPIPDTSRWQDSWAEWLYFNGSTADGATRFYLTFIVGDETEPGRRSAGVRIQLDRGDGVRSFAAGAEVDAAEVLASAPDLTIGRSRVRLEGTRYHVHLDLADEAGVPLRGDLVLSAVPGRSVPPLVIHGAHGWVSGYTVPVLSGELTGRLRVGTDEIDMTGSGYHDHNWGFWEGVTWQWGQVAHDGLSFLYGRVEPPPEAADPARLPGFLAVLGPEGPLGTATDVRFDHEDGPDGRPRRITVTGRGPALDLTMRIDVKQVVASRLGGAMAGAGPAMDFLQMRVVYDVDGRAAGRTIDFTAPGAAETFRR